MIYPSTQTSNLRIAIPPRDVVVPEFIEHYFKNNPIPETVTLEDLKQLGDDLMHAKIRDIEDFNMSQVSTKTHRRIPETLGFDDVAVSLMTIYTFKNIQMTERREDTILAMYDSDRQSPKFGTYQTDTDHLYYIMERIAPKFKRRDMDDVIHKIARSVETVEQTKDRDLFAVRNGIYNQTMDRLEDFSPEYVYMTKIPVDYVENPINPVIQNKNDQSIWDVESWLMELADNNKDQNTLLWQVIADCIQPNVSSGKSVWFYSEKGNNGKGTIGQLIKNLLGKGNYASLSVADFNHEFLKETLLGVAANISDENDVDIFIDSIKDYKASVTGDDININRKYEKALRIQFTGTNLQMMNGLPKTKDKSDSFYRRIILVPFMKSFTNNGEKKYIKDDYINRPEVLEYVLNKALKLKFTEYIVPDTSVSLMASYREKNNPVLEFWNELKDEFQWDLLPTQFLYDLFLKWFERNNPSGKAMSKRSFTDSLNAVINAQGDMWDIRTEQSDKVRTSDKMDADEPLLTEYGLDQPLRNGQPSQWMSPTYKAKDPVRRRDFPRRATYRGYVRL